MNKEITEGTESLTEGREAGCTGEPMIGKKSNIESSLRFIALVEADFYMVQGAAGTPGLVGKGGDVFAEAGGPVAGFGMGVDGEMELNLFHEIICEWSPRVSERASPTYRPQRRVSGFDGGGFESKIELRPNRLAPVLTRCETVRISGLWIVSRLRKR